METDRKKVIIVGITAVAILGGLLLATLVLFKPKQEEPVSPAVELEKPEEILAPLVTWEDPAGFSFDYPGDLQTDSHEEDKENYAHLELTDENHSGGIIIWMKDSNYKKVEDWVDSEDRVLTSQVFDIALGGHDAKKLVLANEGILTAALDQEVIALVEMLPGDVQFWQPIYDQVIKSFQFIPLPTKIPQPQTGGTTEIWEEEEVVE